MDIEEKTFNFALKLIQLYLFLQNNGEYVLSKQLLRSGTSIGANVAEAQAAQSKKDFISKMGIASKEARETLYWLRLLDKANLLSDYTEKQFIIDEINYIVNIITKIVKTSQISLSSSSHKTQNSKHNTSS